MNTYHSSFMLSNTAQQFFVDRFGYNPEAVNITRPDGVTDTAYLIGGKDGFQPWPLDQVEKYVQFMMNPKPEQVEAIKASLRARGHK